MIVLFQMTKFMGDDVINAVFGSRDQFGIQDDRALSGTARPSLGHKSKLETFVVMNTQALNTFNALCITFCEHYQGFRPVPNLQKSLYMQAILRTTRFNLQPAARQLDCFTRTFNDL